VLGIGAAAIFPLSLSVIPVLFAPEERQKAIALMASATFVSFPIGPIVGGYLLDNFWWGSVFLINVPVVAMALIAVAFLLPESRSQQRPRLDVLGVIWSSAGLAALATIAAGVVLLVILVAWERGVGRRGGRALIELSLFRSAGFTWGTALATLVSFAMFGIFFAMPLYFQEVRGVNAMGSGLRLLPMIGGMVIGMIGGTRLASPRRDAGSGAPGGSGDAGSGGPGGSAPGSSVKALVAVGFTVMTVALGVGATTTSGSGTGFAATWFAVFGLGLGLAMPQTMNAALSALIAERSGSGSALISALRQVGATIGVAVLGTVLNTAYRGRLNVTGLSAAAATAAKSSVVEGVGVAHRLGSAALLGSARGAFVTGMDTMLWVCAGIALVSAVLAVLYLPRRADGAPAGDTGPAAVVPSGAERAESGL
jgi:predicted MFS family arabinose efflux permease